MHRQRIAALLLALMLLTTSAISAASGTSSAFIDTPSVIRPGKTERFLYTASEEGSGALHLLDESGGQMHVLQANVSIRAGSNSLFWDGNDAAGQPLAQGRYQLSLRFAGGDIAAQVQVAAPSPQLGSVRGSDAHIQPGYGSWYIAATASMPGLLKLSLMAKDAVVQDVMHQQVPAGDLHIPWDGTVGGLPVQSGLRTLLLTLSDEEGFVSNAYHVLVEVAPTPDPSPQPSSTISANPQATQTSGLSVSTPAPNENTPAVADNTPMVADVNAPAEGRAQVKYMIPSLEPIEEAQWGAGYWTTPVGKWDEEKIWEIMMQPISVLKGRDQRETYKLRKTPDASTARENIVGEITYISQGVHILQTLDNGWTLVEANNSSYGPDNRSRRGYGNTDEIIRGYVETSVLDTTVPRDDFGVLIDKLKQEMYIFKSGKLYTTLMVSTGKPTKAQPWNETPAGEYLMVSRVGDFWAGNLYCAMGMRINGGALIHEVPYLTNETTGYKDYGPQERQLGQKASHGCVRVQRKNNADGVNMAWVWANIKVNTKVLVWDDFPGRYYEHPEDSVPLYYNPNNGQYYHLDQNCPSIKDRYLPLEGSLLYGQLEDAPHQKLKPCPHCIPPIRTGEIDKINTANGF